MAEDSSFGQWLRRRRRALDLTQAALAHEVPCAVQTVRALEAGAWRPSRQLAARVADVLGLPAQEHAAFVALARGLGDTQVAAPLSRMGGGRPPANLPVPLTAFIGRQQEVAAVCLCLRTPTVRLLTLTGPGGSGKTRLALAAATEMLADYADSICFVDLASTHDPALVVPAIAQALNLETGVGPPSLPSLKTYLRDKCLLLVLDNFEQALAAAAAVAELLAAAPALKVLVTSRCALGVYGEHDIAVPPLTLPDLSRLPPVEDLIQNEAVRLFVERAQAARADFALTRENARAVAEICVRLDGLPLAIELAAPRIRVLPPALLLARLSNRLAVLTGGARTLPARQQTLRATLDWSHDLLKADEQRLFRRLAVFGGGWTAQAAEVVAGEMEPVSPASIPGLEHPNQEASTTSVLEGLAALLDNSLIRPLFSGSGAPDEEARFGMLETIREYALERLEASGEVDQIRRRHALYYVALAETAGPELQGAEQQAWQARLDAQMANFRAAFRWAVEHGEAELALRLGAYWAGFMWGVDFWFEWVRWAQDEGLALVVTLPGPIRAKVLKEIARHIWWTQSDYPRVTTLLQEALGLFQAAGDTTGIAETLWYLADVARDEEAYARAGRLYADSLALLQQSADASRSAWLYFSWAEMALLQGEHAQAAARYEQSLPVFRERGPRWSVAWTLHRLGLVAQRQGNAARAAELYREAVALAWELGEPHGIAIGLAGLARIAIELDDQQAPAGQDATSGTVRAARLLGAVAHIHESRALGIARALRIEIDRTIIDARTRLDEASFDAAWAEGRAMTLEQAITYALDDDTSGE